MSTDKACDTLSAILASGVDVHRCAAARALGHIADPGSIDPLVEALLDEDPDVRVDAITALGEFADPRCADVLMESLIGDPCGDVKVSAIGTLARLGHRPVIPWLCRMVAGRDEEIAWDDEGFYDDTWDDWLDIQLAAMRGLGQFGAEEGVADILSALEDEMGQDVSETAIRTLIQLGKPGTEALNGLFSQGDVRMRRRIATVVGADTGEHAGALLDRCLGDTSPQVRMAAARQILERDPLDRRVEQLFSDASAEVRAAALEFAGACYPEQTMRCLDDVSADVKSASYKVVAGHPDEFEGEDFADFVRDAVSGRADVASEAAVAWASLVGERACNALGGALCDEEQPLAFRRGVIGALSRVGFPSTDYLAAVAADDDRQIRLDAMTALADLAAGHDVWPNRAGELLLAALNGELVDPEPEEEETGSPDHVDGQDGGNGPASEPPAEDDSSGDDAEPAVRERDAGPVSTLQTILSGRDDMERAVETGSGPEFELSDEDRKFIALAERRAMSKKKVSLETAVAPYPDIRQFAARLLGGTGRAEVVAPLIAVLGDPDRELCLCTLDSLWRLGETLNGLPQAALEPVVEILEGDDRELRRLAVRVLPWVRPGDVIERLRVLLADQDELVRLEAVRGLAACGAVDAAMESCLADAYPGVRLAAAKAIAHQFDEEAVEPLLAFALANDGMYWREAARLLKGCAPQQATDRFLQILLEETRKREWLVAIEALAELLSRSETEGVRAAA